MLFGMRDAIATPVKIVTISNTPLTQARRVVCSTLKPKDWMISWSWLETEFGTLLNAANNANSQVFGSVKASIILHTDLEQRSDSKYGRCWLLSLEMLVLDSRLVFLRCSYLAQAYNSSHDNILWYGERPLPFHPQSKTMHLSGSLGTRNCIFVNERKGHKILGVLTRTPMP